MIVEEGARGSALLEQEPRMLDGFILIEPNIHISDINTINIPIVSYM